MSRPIRHDDRRRVGGLTWIGWVNLLVVQWFGLRLQIVVRPSDDTQVGYRVGMRWPIFGWSQPYADISLAWIVLLTVMGAVLLG